jgi:hypothetical protein
MSNNSACTASSSLFTFYACLKGLCYGGIVTSLSLRLHRLRQLIDQLHYRDAHRDHLADEVGNVSQWVNVYLTWLDLLGHPLMFFW